MDAKARYQLRGLYSLFLKEWFQMFERHQILVLSYDELKQNPSSCLDRLKRFLCLPTDAVKPGKLHQTNGKPTSEKHPTCHTQTMLAKNYAPFNEELYKLLEDNRGTAAEQHPFPRFQLGKCRDKLDPS